MKAMLKLLIAVVVTAVSGGLSLFAADTSGYFPDATTVEIWNHNNGDVKICDLQRSAEDMNTYSASVTKSQLSNGGGYMYLKFDIKVGDAVFKSDWRAYCADFDGGRNPLPSVLEFSTTKASHTEIGTLYPYETAQFTVKVTSATTLELSIVDKTLTPMMMVIDGKEQAWVDDLNSVTDNVITYDSNIQVQDGGSVTVAVKIGGKTYGVASDAISFDAADRSKQVKTAALTESADAVTLNQKGIYTVAVTLGADGGRTLTITKAAAGNEMTFGEGNGMVFDDVASTWSGTAVLKANAELPALTYTVYGDDGATTATYWFAADIDDPKGEDKTATLTATEPATKAKCLTAGTYKLTVTLGDDGSATATYRNTTPPVEIKDLYVCVYDKNLYPNGTEIGYVHGDTFSFDYEVTERLADGSYEIIVCMENYQTFYIRNNGLAYRPVSKTAGEGVFNEKNTYTFVRSDDSELRKYANDGPGYYKITISANGSNIDVKGSLVSRTTAEDRMKIIKNLAKPVQNEDLADVFIWFLDENGQETPAGLKKMQINPSGTYGLYDLHLKEGQQFHIYRGRAKADGTGLEDDGKVQYGCQNSPADGATSVTITDGDISTLIDQYAQTCNTKTYSVVRDGVFSFVVFYNTNTKQLTVSRKVAQDRGIKIAVYNQDGSQYGELIDMQYKQANRRNLMTVQVPKGGHVKFGFPDEKTGEFVPMEAFYNLGHSNEVGYDTPTTEDMRQSQFDANENDYEDGANLCWYRFRMRLRESGEYCMSYQSIPMPANVWLYVSSPEGATTEYTAGPDPENPGHYIFKDVNLKNGDSYYFVNTKGGKINDDTTGGLIWYCSHTSSGKLNPVKPGRWINMFSHLNVGTDYQGSGYKFEAFSYSSTESLPTLENIEIDMDIATMSHKYSMDYSGTDFYFVGNCIAFQRGFDNGGWGEHDAKQRFTYHPTTGYYTYYCEYLWGDLFIQTNNTDSNYYSYNLNNVIHELNKPYYLSDPDNHYVSEFKQGLPTGTAADTPIKTVTKTTTTIKDGEKTTTTWVNGVETDKTTTTAAPTDSEKTEIKTSPDYKDRFFISMAPGAVGLIQAVDGKFMYDWTNAPVYKDVTVVFDPANNVLWLVSGRAGGEAEQNDPYGECYIVFTDVEPDVWAESRKSEDPDATRGSHWVKLERYKETDAEGNQVIVPGRYYGNDIEFPSRIVNEDGDQSSHCSYFFSNRLGMTLAETIRYSNSYHAGATDPTDFSETATDEAKYGSVFTKLVYNEAGRGGDGSFESTDKPMSLIETSATAYASTIYVRRWDNNADAPFENCYKPTDEGEGDGTAPEAKTVRRAEGEDNADAGSNGVEDTPDGTVYVTTTDKDPSGSDNYDPDNYIVRTFASEPYTYDVSVDLGRQQFSLVTAPRDVTTGIGELPSAEGADEGPAAVIRAAAGHISVTGAHSVSVYTLSGQCLLNGAQEADMDVAPGIYIIVADGRASKFAL